MNLIDYKLYYYEYRDSCMNTWTSWYVSGFIMETPLGIIRWIDEDEVITYESMKEFVKQMSIRYSFTFDMVEL